MNASTCKYSKRTNPSAGDTAPFGFQRNVFHQPPLGFTCPPQQAPPSSPSPRVREWGLHPPACNARKFHRGSESAWDHIEISAWTSEFKRRMVIKFKYWTSFCGPYLILGPLFVSGFLRLHHKYVCHGLRFSLSLSLSLSLSVNFDLANQLATNLFIRLQTPSLCHDLICPCHHTTEVVQAHIDPTCCQPPVLAQCGGTRVVSSVDRWKGQCSVVNLTKESLTMESLLACISLSRSLRSLRRDSSSATAAWDMGRANCDSVWYEMRSGEARRWDIGARQDGAGRGEPGRGGAASSSLPSHLTFVPSPAHPPNSPPPAPAVSQVLVAVGAQTRSTQSVGCDELYLTSCATSPTSCEYRMVWIGLGLGWDGSEWVEGSKCM